MKRAKSQRHILAAVTIQRKISVSILSQEFENERILPSIGIKRIIRRKQQSCLYSPILINSQRCASYSLILKFLIKTNSEW